MAPHPYLKLRLPSNAPFQLKKASPGKGWGGFATRNLHKGGLILTEDPLFTIYKWNDDITDADVQQGFNKLSQADTEQFLYLRDNGGKKFQYLGQVFEQNSFETDPNMDLPCPQRGIYLLHSRFNHSCLPNARIPNERGETMKLFATKDISSGEEITFCYGPNLHALTRNERHKILGLVCDCKACVPGTPFQHLSDMRRRLIRGIQYLILGVDIDNKLDTSASPLIIEKGLKDLAEKQDWPLGNMFVLNILSVCLNQAEGLLDDFMVRTLEPYIRKMAATFHTPKNARIAKRAMQQPTWQGRFVVALGVWREWDDADFHLTAMRIRDEMSQGPPGTAVKPGRWRLPESNNWRAGLDWTRAQLGRR